MDKKPIPTEYRSTHITSVDPNTAGPTQDGIPKQFWARVLNYGVLDDYGTKFKPGAFTKSLQRRLPRLMYGHAGWENPSALLGRAVDYRDSSDGLDLLFEFDDFNFVPMARQIAHQMTNDPSNPTLDQFSVGFKRLKDERASQQMGGGVWITEGRLGETSVVVEGAVPGTRTLQFRDANGAVLDGQTIDANDAARLLAELSTGKVDLADALAQVKQLAAYDPEPEEEDEEEEDEDEELEDEAPAEDEDEEDEEEEEDDEELAAAAAAKLAEEEAALNELSDTLVAVGSRHPFVEMRGDRPGHKFHGNQHGNGGGGDEARAARIAATKKGDLVSISGMKGQFRVTAREGTVLGVKQGSHEHNTSIDKVTENFSNISDYSADVETRGDKPGHKFHGNQHNGGGGSFIKNDMGTDTVMTSGGGRLGTMKTLKSGKVSASTMSGTKIGEFKTKEEAHAAIVKRSKENDAKFEKVSAENKAIMSGQKPLPGGAFVKQPIAGNTLPKDVQVTSAGRGKGHEVKSKAGGTLGTIKKNADGDYEWTSAKTGKSGVNKYGPKSLAMAKQQLLGHHNVSHYNDEDKKRGN